MLAYYSLSIVTTFQKTGNRKATVARPRMEAFPTVSISTCALSNFTVSMLVANGF